MKDQAWAKLCVNKIHKLQFGSPKPNYIKLHKQKNGMVQNDKNNSLGMGKNG